MSSRASSQQQSERRRQELQYLADGERVPVVLEALCFSTFCAPGGAASGTVVVGVSKHAVFCPNCNHALCWRQRKIFDVRPRRT